MPAYDTSRFTPPAPVATVTLRHPNSGRSVTNVLMLIDSGADVTLLPSAAVELLGLACTGDTNQLQAFDGTISESGVVQADLVFLGKRFRGSFW